MYEEIANTFIDLLASMNQSSESPITNAVTITPVRYPINERIPNSFLTTIKVAIFGAGPVSINTNAAPGDMPDNMSPAATGVEAVAQIYIGIEINTAMTMAKIPLPYSLSSVGGTNV